MVMHLLGKLRAGIPPIPQVTEGSTVQPRKAAPPTAPVVQSVGGASTYQRRLTTCKAELQQLVQQKREQCSAERMAKQMMESTEWESRPPPPGGGTLDTPKLPQSNFIRLTKME